MQDLAEEEPDAVPFAEAAADRPEDSEVDPRFALYWGAWWDLRNDRSWGQYGGAYAIPFGAIDTWARRYGIDAAEFERLKQLVAAMDGVFIEITAERAREAMESNRGGAKGEGG